MNWEQLSCIFTSVLNKMIHSASEEIQRAIMAGEQISGACPLCVCRQPLILGRYILQRAWP